MSIRLGDNEISRQCGSLARRPPSEVRLLHVWFYKILEWFGKDLGITEESQILFFILRDGSCKVSVETCVTISNTMTGGKMLHPKLKLLLVITLCIWRCGQYIQPEKRHTYQYKNYKKSFIFSNHSAYVERCLMPRYMTNQERHFPKMKQATKNLYKETT